VQFYRAALDLSRSTLNYLAGPIRRRSKAIGSTWRLLNPGRQALLVLAYLHKDETFTEISAGFAVSATTAWRYVEETVMLLSARSPKLTQALRKAAPGFFTKKPGGRRTSRQRSFSALARLYRHRLSKPGGRRLRRS